MSLQPLAIVSDFDGTIVTADLGDEVARRHAPPDAWEAFERDWLGGKLTLVEAQRRIWALVQVTPERFLAIVDEVADLRAGFESFLATAQMHGVPFVVASNGFQIYIDRVLRAANGLQIYANQLEFGPDATLTAVFPHADRFGCPTCGVCKGRVVEELRAKGYRVAFLGDGGSDRCAAGRADELFAVAGASFERWLRERGIAHRSFTSFDEVAAALGL